MLLTTAECWSQGCYHTTYVLYPFLNAWANIPPWHVATFYKHTYECNSDYVYRQVSATVHFKIFHYFHSTLCCCLALLHVPKNLVVFIYLYFSKMLLGKLLVRTRNYEQLTWGNNTLRKDVSFLSERENVLWRMFKMNSALAVGRCMAFKQLYAEA